MDLWIRSQDGKSIYKITGIYYEEKSYGQKHHYIYTSDENCLGVYESEKRALEILDAISSFIRRGEINQLRPDASPWMQIDTINKLSGNLDKIGKVYNMPEE